MASSKKKNQNRFKNLLIVSVALNILFIFLTALTILSLRFSDTTVAEYNALQTELCETNYDKYLNRWGEANGDEGKKSFAMLVCLRNYKTGEPLDLKPLDEQIK